jgi:hypothetical protein
MGGILSGAYKLGTGISGVFGGSPQRAAIDETYASKMYAADVGELEAKQIGASDAAKARTAGTQLIAQQGTAYTASGVDPTQGTPLSVMADTRLMSELDARTLENNAARKVRGFKEQRRQADAEHHMRISEDQQNQIGNMLSGIGDIAGGAAGFSK